MRSTFKITFYVNKGKEKNGVAPVFNIFPKSAENLLITQLYKGFGLTVETIKKLFTGEAVTVTGKLHPAAHN